MLGSKPIAIPRERIQSLEPKHVPNPVRGQALQVEITYRAGDFSGDVTNTVLLGAYLTVEPTDLVNGLVVWRDVARDSQTGLMDQVDQMLRREQRRTQLKAFRFRLVDLNFHAIRLARGVAAQFD